MIMHYILYVIFVIIWITGVYLFFNRKNNNTEVENELLLQTGIIATPYESKIRVVFDQFVPNPDIKSLSDFTVKYSDLIAGNYRLQKSEEIESKLLTGREEQKETEKMDLAGYINILTIKTKSVTLS